MTIEIHQPELEALIRLRMDSGQFTSVEDVLLQALKFSASAGRLSPHERNLVEVCAMVRGLAEDLDISRDASPGRPLDLS